jgi:hypothetical protein
MGNSSSQFGKTSVYKETVVETPENVEEISTRPGYYKNKKGVFYDGVQILSKPETIYFKKLKYSYAKTNTHVFYKGTIIPDANPKTFITINRKNIPDEFKNLNSVIGMDFENNTKRIYQFGIKIYTFKV